AAGSEVTRFSAEDVQRFRQAAVPVWYSWAKKDEDAKRVFKLQLDYMMNDIMGYVTPDDIKGLSL
ncbi:MAG: hypothetical protein R3194_10475, partial [Limnobacter sp.]|nr:hypothetical protein [Limnobacter sp.]